jgi:hypothetical protein
MQQYLSVLPLALQAIFSSTTPPMATYPSNPAWKPAFQDSLASQKTTFFQLATVSAPLVPRCRTLSLLGFLGETPYSTDTPIEPEQQNPPGALSDLLYVASDARSQKIAELKLSPAVEATFFFPALWSQFRVRGKAFSVGYADRDGEVRALLEMHMSLPQGWEWQRELRKIWELQDAKLIKAKYPVPVTPPYPQKRERREGLLMQDRRLRNRCRMISDCW